MFEKFKKNIGKRNKIMNFIRELEYVEKKTINNAKKRGNLSHQKMRSMIHPQYANRFIRQYIID